MPASLAPLPERLTAAIQLAQSGEREAARALFRALWEDPAIAADPIHRCALAHHAADVQDDPRDELEWDLRALAAAREVADQVPGFFASLHLNVAEACRKLGDLTQARAHAAHARAALTELDDDGYAKMIRGGLDRLEKRLE